MVFMQRYASPLGGLLLAADEQGLIGLWFDGARHFAANLPEAREEKRTPILDETARWLDDGASARAVGGAVGRNPISIIVPCHRVIGADGSLTGYAGGMDRKIRLLALERQETKRR